MQIKDLKEIIANLSDEMLIVAFDSQGMIKNATAYIDGPEQDHQHQEEWLVITTEGRASQ